MKPIIFSDMMIVALLEGRKTQTRRVVKLLKPCRCVVESRALIVHNREQLVDANGEPNIAGAVFGTDPYVKVNACLKCDTAGGRIRCPYGVVGDSLWVRETIAPTSGANGGDPEPSTCENADSLWYRATDTLHLANSTPTGKVSPPLDTYAMVRPEKWMSPVFMPKWASRMTIKLSDVRAERVQALTEPDALAEGISEVSFYPDDGYPLSVGYMIGKDDKRSKLDPSPIQTYARGFDEINGAGTWDRNPLVWRLCFSVTEKHGLKEDGRG